MHCTLGHDSYSERSRKDTNVICVYVLEAVSKGGNSEPAATVIATYERKHPHIRHPENLHKECRNRYTSSNNSLCATFCMHNHASFPTYTGALHRPKDLIEVKNVIRIESGLHVWLALYSTVTFHSSCIGNDILRCLMILYQDQLHATICVSMAHASSMFHALEVPADSHQCSLCNYGDAGIYWMRLVTRCGRDRLSLPTRKPFFRFCHKC